jgi:predicted nucleic acid-binding protein
VDLLYIIPDSSFYICFIDDIEDCESLIEILKNKAFRFVIGIVVKGEIKKSKKYQIIEDYIENSILYFSETNYGELLKPLFSEEELRKGENEVITISYILFDLNYDFITILDDDEPRKFFLINFPEFADKLKGSIGFIKDCVCIQKIFTKDKGLNILACIKNSKFRIKKDIINDIIEKIKGC